MNISLHHFSRTLILGLLQALWSSAANQTDVGKSIQRIGNYEHFNFDHKDLTTRNDS